MWELTIPRDCDFERWKGLVNQVRTLRNQTSWALADLLVYADKQHWLKEAQAHMIGLGYRDQTMRNFLRVGNRFPPKSRIFRLSFSHYVLSVGRGTEAEKWLAKAQQGDAGVPWSYDQLYSKIGEERPQPSRPMLVRQKVKERVRYNRPHTEDPFATFEVVALQTAQFIREQVRLPVAQRRVMARRVGTVIDSLILALTKLEASLPPDDIEVKAS